MVSPLNSSSSAARVCGRPPSSSPGPPDPSGAPRRSAGVSVDQSTAMICTRPAMMRALPASSSTAGSEGGLGRASGRPPSSSGALGARF